MKEPLARQAYTLLAYALIPPALLRLAWLGLRNPGYRQRWRERFGWVRSSPPALQPIWLHAVSVGEVQAAAPLVEALERDQPGVPILVTTTTPTGAATVARLFGDRVAHCYVPYDLPAAVRRFIARRRPRALLLMETELWPNLVACSVQRGIPVALINARLSSRSLAGYRRIPALVRPLLSRLSAIAAQSEADARRLRTLGAPPEAMVVTGSLKFDIRHSAGTRELGDALRHRLGPNRPRWIAASTHPGEETLVLKVQQTLGQRYPEVQLILAPRHPDRSDEVAELCHRQGLSVVRQSEACKGCQAAVYLVDCLGELPACYAASDVAFVGGSLVGIGGHNVLEPADLAVPILFGPQVFNFQSICDALVEAGGARRVRNEAELAVAIDHLLADAQERDRMGSRARALVDANRGSVARVLELIRPLILTD